LRTKTPKALGLVQDVRLSEPICRDALAFLIEGKRVRIRINISADNRLRDCAFPIEPPLCGLTGFAENIAQDVYKLAIPSGFHFAARFDHGDQL
jgi:hypothetical protein